MTSSGIRLRPIAAEDEPFLYEVYASTREEELAPLDWPPEQKDRFLRMQFDAQHRYYKRTFANAAFDVILDGDRPIGRLYVDRREDELRIVDIALLSTERRRGVGGRLLRELMKEAAGAGLPVRIHVERENPALGLYRDLGFVETGDTGVYYLMQWTPPTG